MEITYTLDEINHVAKMIISALELKRVILLKGEMGAGKTRLSGEIIRVFLGERDLVVQSPTYSIINMYSSDVGVVAHLDLYRVKHSEELYELGLQEMFKYSLCIIEWPEITQNFPMNSREVCHITIAGAGDTSRHLLINC